MEQQQQHQTPDVMDQWIGPGHSDVGKQEAQAGRKEDKDDNKTNDEKEETDKEDDPDYWNAAIDKSTRQELLDLRKMLTAKELSVKVLQCKLDDVSIQKQALQEKFNVLQRSFTKMQQQYFATFQEQRVITGSVLTRKGKRGKVEKLKQQQPPPIAASSSLSTSASSSSTTAKTQEPEIKQEKAPTTPRPKSQVPTIAEYEKMFTQQQADKLFYVLSEGTKDQLEWACSKLFPHHPFTTQFYIPSQLTDGKLSLDPKFELEGKPSFIYFFDNQPTAIHPNKYLKDGKKQSVPFISERDIDTARATLAVAFPEY